MRFTPALLAATLAVAPLAAAPALAEGGLITISGLGEAAAKPDMATITMGVERRADTAAAALAAVSDALQPVIQELGALGVPPADIQTSGLRLDAELNYDVSPPEQTGFVAGSTLTVKITDLDGAGALIDAVVSAGANQLQGISFGLSDSAAALEEARRAAVADALEKAQVYADAAGLTLGPIAALTEGGASLPPMAAQEMRMMDAGGSMPIAAGELTVSASVSISWEIADDAAD
ncbi:SIMPL domain-containing protein [Pseudoroseicyclus sp. CXY001]|uniref:SIMPL domain-containing protein n=1 Tax=Pseudoroseicyclus sp. CXY001 TaxID=3242492 RepID=UPI003570C134